MTKKFVSMFLALVMCLSLTATSVGAVEDVAETSHPEIDFDGPMVFYPFVYTEEPGWAWAREIIGDCSACVPGYLYLQNLTTKEITQIIEEPVDMFRSDNEILYCLVDATSIIRTNYWGEGKTVLYASRYGNLANLKYGDGILLFSDGDHVVQLDIATGKITDMGIYEGLADIYMNDDSFTWVDEHGVEYIRNADDYDELLSGPIEMSDHAFDFAEGYAEVLDSNEITPYAVIAGPVTFPLANYPVGSFYTKNGYACADHYIIDENGEKKDNPDCPKSTCNCRYYKGGYQCEGFARYAMDQYAHYTPIAENWYQPGDPHVIISEDTTIKSGVDIKLLLSSTSAGYGTYIRVKRPSGTHAMVIADITSTGLTIYDANFSSSEPCVVKFTTYTYEKFAQNMTSCVKRVTAHLFYGTYEQENSKYHKVLCAYDGCEGYTFVEHASTNPGKKATCAYCGYVGEIWNYAPIVIE